jgi:selenocysteine lyase/cysteine desulfurase
VRVAPGFYTTSAEVEEFLAALRTLSTWRRR